MLPIPWAEKYALENELTYVGLRQHYNLGKYISQKYGQLFDHLFANDELFARTTGQNNTLQSANAHLMGIFDQFQSRSIAFPADSQQETPYWVYHNFNLSSIEFTTPLPQKYNPYPVWSPTYNTEDYFLGAGTNFCSDIFSLMVTSSRLFDLSLVDSVYLKTILKKVFTKFELSQEKIFDNENSLLQNSYELAKFFIADYYNSDKSYLQPKTSEYDKNLLIDLKKVYSLASYRKFNNIAYLHTTITPWLTQIQKTVQKKVDLYRKGDLDIFQNKTGRDLSKDDREFSLKYQLFIGDEGIITAFLIASGYIDKFCLENEFSNDSYGDNLNFEGKNCRLVDLDTSTLVFELIDLNFNPNGNFSLVKNLEKTNQDKLIMRVFYNGQYINFCNSETANTYDCPLQDFYDKIYDITVSDFTYSCSGYDTNSDTFSGMKFYISYNILWWISLALLIVIGLILIGVIWAVKFSEKKNQFRLGDYFSETNRL